MKCFDHEKLDVYKVAIALVVLIDEGVKELPRGRSYLDDQLLRACTSSSVPLNIEGAGEYSINEKIRFYRMARRSATQCAGIIDVCSHLQLINKMRYFTERDLLMRIVAMLTKTAQGIVKINFKCGHGHGHGLVHESGTGTGTGTGWFTNRAGARARARARAGAGAGARAGSQIGHGLVSRINFRA